MYGEDGRRKIDLTVGSRGREAEVEELYEAVVNDRPVFHDGRWGEATLEVCLGMIQSSAEKREILLTKQVQCA